MEKEQRDVFISYAHEDTDRARPLAELLEELGWSVWFDHDIPAGAKWETAIQAQVERARCVVVLWSRHSIESDWVQREAEVGLKRGVLIPGLLENVDMPEAFRGVQSAVLMDWRGGRLHLGIQHLLHALPGAIGRDAVVRLGLDPHDLGPIKRGERGGRDLELADFERDVFVLSAGGQPFGTGFLLGRTSLLVTDSNVYNGLLYAGRRGNVHALDATALEGGDAFSTRLVLPPDHAQDYALLDASPHLGTGAIGLGDDGGVAEVGQKVVCVVAVGDGKGLLRGRVTGTGENEKVHGVPGGPTRIESLVTTDIVTQQGSAGAPVLAPGGVLVGMVVAGDHLGRSLLLGTERIVQRLRGARLVD